MPTVTIVTGVLLIVLGAVGFIGTGSVHYTALIPAAFGLILAICGFIAKAPEKKKLFMHIAVTVGLLGFLGGAVQSTIAFIKAGGGPLARPEATEAQVVMAAICGVYVGLCVNSFIKARRSRG